MTRPVISEETLDVLDELLHALYVLERDFGNQPPQSIGTASIELVSEASCPPSVHGSNPSEIFDIEKFWYHYFIICQSISKESTNMCMVFTDQFPTAAICKSITERLSKPILNLYAHYSLLPATLGLLCRKAYFNHVLTVTKRLNQLIVAIKSGPERIQLASQKTGSVWEACDAGAELPKNNLRALAAVIDVKLVIVDDALSELKQWLKEELEADSSLATVEEHSEGLIQSNATKAKICTFVIGMVKALKAILKQTASNVLCLEQNFIGSLITASAIIDLSDRVGLKIENADSWSDDMAVALYSYADGGNDRSALAELAAQAEILKSNGIGLIDDVTGLVSNDVTNWKGETKDEPLVIEQAAGGIERFKFLTKVFNHNLCKIRELGGLANC